MSEQDHAQAVGYSNQEEFYPPHPPRAETTEYTATHHLLVDVLDTPCKFCGVRKSKLGTPENIFGSKDLETHHWPVQRELADACDWRKVAKDFPKDVLDQESFLHFVDSPSNMVVACVPPKSPILMGDGSLRPIGDIRVGDSVIGHDLQPHTVTATTRHRHDGQIIVINRQWMTDNHPVLVETGWIEAGLLTGTEVICQVRMAGSDVLGLRRNDRKILDPVIVSNPIEMMDNLVSAQATTDMLLHNPSVLGDSTPLPIAPNPSVNVSPGALCGIQQSIAPLTRKAIQPFQSAFVGAKLLLTVIRRSAIVSGALLANEISRVFLMRLSPALSATGPGAGGVSVRQTRRDGEFAAADKAIQYRRSDITSFEAFRSSVNHITRLTYSGDVCNLEVEGSHSYVAGGVVVHNCDVCHRGPNGLHHDVIANVLIRKYLLDGYVLTGRGADATADLAKDEQIVDAAVPVAERI